MKFLSLSVALCGLAASCGAQLTSVSGSPFHHGAMQKEHNVTFDENVVNNEADLSDDNIVALAGTELPEQEHTQGVLGRVLASKQQNISRTHRRVFIDLGANWANTLRLYEDLMPAMAGQPWEVYGFEASPFIQPCLEKFVAFLNGQGPRPPTIVPPSGSSLHLNEFAERYGC